jgi:hypothetical protein
MGKVELRNHLSKIGRKGGRSKSPAKMRAIAKNLKKANKKRHVPTDAIIRQ